MNMQMTSLDILYVSLSLGFLVLVGFLVFLIIKASKTLDSLNLLLEDVDDTASEIRQLKNTVKFGIFSGISMLTGILSGKGGGKIAKR